MNHTPALFLFLLFLTLQLPAQEGEKIRLLDKTSRHPIEGATYHYASQSGTSSKQGIISIAYQQGAQLKLSHVAYGGWVLSDKAVRAALNTGRIIRQSQSVTLQPVSVIALHGANRQQETLSLDYQDNMAHDGGAVLQQNPAISGIRKSGSYGFDPVLRGFKYQRLNVVLNGSQSATAACPNRMDPPTSQMAPNMTKRIEVLKGPHALRYGNGFGGTVNFIPADLRFSNAPEFYGRLSARYGHNGSTAKTEGLLGFSGKRYDLRLLGAWAHGKDYAAGDGTTIPADFMRNSIGASLGVKPAPNQEVRLSVNRNFARDVDFAALPMDLRKDDTYMLHAEHKLSLTDKAMQSLTTSISGSFVDHRMDNTLKPLDPRMLNAATNAKTRNYGGRSEAVWNFGAGQIFAGADFRVEEANGTRSREFLMGPNKGVTVTDNVWQESQIAKTGLFAEYHWQRQDWQWIVSGRLEWNIAELRDQAEAFSQEYSDTQSGQLNPGISIGGVRQLGNRMQAGLWLGRVHRSGGLTERFINYLPVGPDPYEMLGNPRLQPEKNNQADLTLSYQHAGTTLEIDFFAAYLQDYISSRIDTTLEPRMLKRPGVRRYTNIREALQTGFEIAWHQELFAGLQNRLSLAYTFGKDLVRNAPLPEIAPMDIRYQLYGSFLQGHLKPSVSFRHVLKQNRVSRTFGETQTPAFTVMNIKIAYRLKNYLRITAGVENLFDETYYEHLSRPVQGNSGHPIYARGRNVFLAVNVNLM